MPAFRHIRVAGPIIALAGAVLAAPIFIPVALAQMAGAGPGMGGSAFSSGGLGGPHPHAQHHVESIAPPALPGTGGAGDISAGPIANASGDPTTLLFQAINHGDYALAQAAIGRGANLDARNALNETPIELSVELNRNQITFMLLSVRAEEGHGGTVGATTPAGFTPAKTRTTRPTHTQHTATRPIRPEPPAPLPNNPGVANPAAGFLGFGGNS